VDPGIKVKQFYDVWEMNAEVFDIFMASAGNWNRLQDGQITGLNYPALDAVMNLMEVTDRKTKFQDIRAMESACLEVFKRGR
jgi:hypothetical protein